MRELASFYAAILEAIFGKREDLLPLRLQDIERIDKIMSEALSLDELTAITKRYKFANEPEGILSHQEIGTEMGITQNIAHGLCASAMSKLKAPEIEKKFRIFFREFLESDVMVLREIIDSTTLSTHICEIGFSTRAFNGMRSMGIKTLGDLIQVQGEQLINAKNMGRKTVDEIREKLAALGLKLNELF